MKCNCRLLVFCGLVLGTTAFGQTKQEREYRIAKEEFPEMAISSMDTHLNDVKRLRFYKEIDGKKASYEIKFKKGKLHYSVEFDTQGGLEDVEFVIKPNDIPDDVFAKIKTYLNQIHGKHRLKKIQQQYVLDGEAPEALLKKAFQNLLTPAINYEIIVAAKDRTGYGKYEITFTAKGEHLSTRKSVNPNYDHVLYE